jgi:predicted phage tail protein
MASDDLIRLISIPLLLALVVVAFLPFYGSVGVNYLDESQLNNSLVDRVIAQGNQTITFAEDVKDDVSVISTPQEESGTFGFVRDIFSSMVGSVVQSARIIFSSLAIFGVLITEGVGALQFEGAFNTFLIAMGTTMVLLLIIGIWLKWMFKI